MAERKADGNRGEKMGNGRRIKQVSASKSAAYLPVLISFWRWQQSLRQNLKTGLTIPITKVRQNGSVLKAGKSNKLVIAELH